MEGFEKEICFNVPKKAILKMIKNESNDEDLVLIEARGKYREYYFLYPLSLLRRSNFGDGYYFYLKKEDTMTIRKHEMGDNGNIKAIVEKELSAEELAYEMEHGYLNK